MNIKELLQKPLKTLLLAFFNTKVDNNRFLIYSDFRKSKFSDEKLNKDIYERERNNMANCYELNFILNRTSIYYEINNDIQLSLEEFLTKIYNQIILLLSQDGSEFENELMMAIFAPRGSVDFAANYYAVDLIFENEKYVDLIFRLFLQSKKILNYLNLNFRQLQGQYIAKINQRNTQIRIDLGWFYTFNRFLHQINEYKANLLDYQASNNAIRPHKYVKPENMKSTFIERIGFYKNKIIGNDLQQSQIDNLRNKLFENDNETPISRNQKIKLFVQETIKDECVGCSDIYKIEDRSFIMPHNNNHWYLEINHIIPFANDRENADVVENLVKLCPTCHKALTPLRAKKELQLSIIKKMINSRNEVRTFIENMKIATGNNNKDTSEYVLSVLK
jgi:5-methylcytosine-specific restriction protein A